MKRQIRKARRHFVHGLASLLVISDTPPKRRRVEPMDALRGDMEKIGGDMYRVVEREKAREEASRKALSAAE